MIHLFRADDVELISDRLYLTHEEPETSIIDPATVKAVLICCKP